MRYYSNFSEAIRAAENLLLTQAQEVDPGTWQGVPTGGKPDLMTREVMNFGMSVPVSRYVSTGNQSTLEHLANHIQPNLPWADNHFAERVSRDPSNPGEQYKNWPWWRDQDETTMENGKFTHTYQERFWPKWASAFDTDWGRKAKLHEGEKHGGRRTMAIEGIRYSYGDLDDVVALLVKEPQTRQAYLPIFFPEDTGAVHGGRIPCSLGYHFMMRNDQLNCWYDIRSCDLVRHFRDDIYLACRLLLWVLDEVTERWLRQDANHQINPHDWSPGMLHMNVHSLHFHMGDAHHVR
jgi:hypothetical protein